MPLGDICRLYFVQKPISRRFQKMFRLYLRIGSRARHPGCFQVGNRPCHFQDSRTCSCRQSHPRRNLLHQSCTFFRKRAELPYHLSRHLRIDMNARPLESGFLHLSCGTDSLGDRRTRLVFPVSYDLFRRYRPECQLNIDPVHYRAGKTGNV